MVAFESLLLAHTDPLAPIFAQIPADGDQPANVRRERIAASLGLNPAELVCGLGFNAEAIRMAEVIAKLGYANQADLIEQRDFLFINDPYRFLPLNNILAIYHKVTVDGSFLNLVLARLNRMEMELDRTLSPAVINGYKREVWSLYECRIGQPQMAELRLGEGYGGLRALTDEVLVLAETRILPIEDLFCRASVSPDEKRRLLDRGYITADLLQRRLQEPGLSEAERQVLQEWQADHAV